MNFKQISTTYVIMVFARYIDTVTLPLCAIDSSYGLTYDFKVLLFLYSSSKVQQYFETCKKIGEKFYSYTIDIKDAATEIIRFSRQFLILSAAVTGSPTILLFPSPWQHPYHSPASFWQSQGFASPCPFSFLQPGPLLYLLAWRYQSNS